IRRSESSPTANPVLGLACSEPRPILALEFEEPADSAFFADSSGFGNDAFCSDVATCPLSGVDGRIGNGVNFDGTNDALSLTFAQSDGAFSSDLWIRTTKQSAEI